MGEFQIPRVSCAISSCIVPAVSCFQLFPGRNRRRRPRWRGSSSSKNNKQASSSGGGNNGSSFPTSSGGLDLEFVAEPVELRSMSFVGTHEYLAPEIVSGEGHGSSVDWWTLGVFIFELLYGATPFKGHDNDATLANIVARALEFPRRDPPVSPAARDLVAALLVKDPACRLGAVVGAAAIKRHPFFAGVNWALLRCAPPPYVPPPFTLAAVAKAKAGPDPGCDDEDDASDDSCPGTPVEYY